MFFMAILAANLALSDPISGALMRWNELNTYTVTLKSGEDGNYSEIIRYFYKKPGFIRMEFEKPYKGAVLVYKPRQKKVKIRLSGLLRSFTFTFSPDNSIVKSSKGHRVDESDMGSLLKMVKKLQNNGELRILGDEIVGGREVVQVVIEGNGDHSVDGAHSYHLWLDKTAGLPIKVMAFDITGALVEQVLMDDLKVDMELKDDIFSP